MKQNYLQYTNWYALLLCLWSSTVNSLQVDRFTTTFTKVLINPFVINNYNDLLFPNFKLGHAIRSIISLLIFNLDTRVLTVNSFVKHSKPNLTTTIC